MDFKDRDILDFISGHPGLIPRSGVILGRLRDSSERLTPYFSGERLVYVKGNFVGGGLRHTHTLVVDVESLITTHQKQLSVKHFFVIMMASPFNHLSLF